MEGQVYCSVNGGGRSGGGRLCVYDSSRNRSENPGEVVFCGLANFTMVRYVELLHTHSLTSWVCSLLHLFIQLYHDRH